MWEGITYPFPNFDGPTVEVWEWIISFIHALLLGMWFLIHAVIKVSLSQIARFMGSARGPPGSCRPQVSPMLVPWTLLSGMLVKGAPVGNNRPLHPCVRNARTPIHAISQQNTQKTWLMQYLTTPWWRHQMEAFSRYWPFVRGIHRSPVNSPHKGQWRGALMFSLISARINGWVNNREAGDVRRHRAHHDVNAMHRNNSFAIVTGAILKTNPDQLTINFHMWDFSTVIEMGSFIVFKNKPGYWHRLHKKLIIYKTKQTKLDEIVLDWYCFI